MPLTIKVESRRLIIQVDVDDPKRFGEMTVFVGHIGMAWFVPEIPAYTI